MPGNFKCVLQYFYAAYKAENLLTWVEENATVPKSTTELVTGYQGSG